MADNVDFGALRAQTMGTGHDEEAVTVNTRALIDKVLARYSGEWTVLRELLQNAADAGASNVTIRFETLPSTTKSLPSQASSAALLQHTVQYHTLKRLLISNDGQVFGANDWARLKRIAEGNPDETKIGAFGVGFYSVFSDCEEPFVSSGDAAMAFYWKGNQLFTKILRKAEGQGQKNTTFMLEYRNTTNAVPALLPLCRFLASSLTFVSLNGVEVWLDGWQLFSLNKTAAPARRLPIPRTLETRTPDGLMKVESVEHETLQLSAKWLNIVGWDPKASATLANVAANSTQVASQSLRSFFSKFSSHAQNAEAAKKAALEAQAKQQALLEDLVGENSTTIFLNVATAAIVTSVSGTFGKELDRATKKPAPKATKLAVLTTSHHTVQASEDPQANAKRIDIFSTVLPSQSGRIFIGFPTHQTTGIAAHISAPSVIPTVERESIDLNARWVRSWNMEMLRAAGIVCRVAWTEEMHTIESELRNQLSREDRTKIRKDDIGKVLPSATHLLNQFAFKESTPASQVGALVEEAFWTCNKQVTIEVLSSRGVLPSEKVRLATDELSFVDGIPIVPQELYEKARPFIGKLVDFGVITEVTTADIKSELERQALDEKQFREFLGWLGRKARTQQVDTAVASSLLMAAVVNDNETGKVLMVGNFKHFLNPSRIPGSMPLPANTVPFKFTKSIDRRDLEAMGWQDLHLVPWIRFLLEQSHEKGELPENQRFTTSSEFAAQVLPVISKQWEGLSQSSKMTVINILVGRTVIPTKCGLMKPVESYFPSVKLFDDLPVITVVSLREKFLTSLGVRKTVQLNLVFERLLSNDKGKSDSSPAWSHVELIKYLASVRGDIPKEEIKKLASTPIAPAEKDTSTQKYRLRELFEPKPELRALNLKLLQWPPQYRPQSDEAKFMRSLGLREYPNTEELITLIATATVDSNGQFREKGLKYFVDFFHQHGYSSREVGESKIAFLPLEGQGNETAIPAMCFTDKRTAVMGFQILREDLHPHATKFGVRTNPPIEDCALWLVKNPPQNPRMARQLFEYFSTRLPDLSGKPLSMLSGAQFVPILNRAGSGLDEKRRLRYVTPSMCFLGSGGRYAQIFDYVDFGPMANPFLMHCGSKMDPSITELATIITREPARIFNMFEDVHKYIDILAELAKEWSTLKKNKALVQEMKKSSFLVASKEVPKSGQSKRPQSLALDPEFQDEDETIRTFQLAPPHNIVINDDPINFRLFKGELLTAPFDEDVEQFYEVLGAAKLSNLVDEKPRLSPPNSDQTSAARLRSLILERIKLFYHYHDVSKEQMKKPVEWLEKKVEFISVSSIRVYKTLKGRLGSIVEETTALTDRDSKIWFIPGSKDPYNVSRSLLQILLKRPTPNQGVVLTTLLETDLNRLRARGYDVSRILKRREAEARKANEEQRRQLQEEQQRMLEARTRYNAQTTNAQATSTPEKGLMPGGFPDDGSPNGVSNGQSVSDAFRPLSSFFGQGRMPNPLGGPGANAQVNGAGSGDVRTPHKPVTTPEQLRKNLRQAIKAARPHDSQKVVNKGVINEVQETKTFCDARPAQNIGFFGAARRGTKVFLPNPMPDKPRFWFDNLDAIGLFEDVLLAVAGAMDVSPTALHIFTDEESETIAFNSNGALFCNYRYFFQLHVQDVRQGDAADAMVYWFVTLCHEVAHNLSSDHGSAHSFYTESLIAQYFAPLARTLAAGMPSGAAGQGNMVEAPPPAYRF